jgi:cell division GTPase FtsZ
MNILLMSLGGGGGNILRSVKTLFHRDLVVSEKTDPAYAERLKKNVATRFLDTNQFSLLDIPEDERVLIGGRTTSHLGSRHDPEVAQRAFDESRSEIEALISGYAVVVVIATGGKGTGAGTIVPVTLAARQQKKLVIPVFVRPSFDRHEVEKRRFDHALTIGHRLDAAGIRFVEVLNDRGYVETDPQPQSVVWERMNVPIARALRGLLYVLWDLSQVDPSDLSSLFAGHGRMRIGFSEIDPPSGTDPTDDQIEEAVTRCWENPFCSFSGPAGTSLICIQGQWSNVADAKIKGRLAARAVGAHSSPYNPLYARAFQPPKPWGVTALFAEYTGNHAPIDIRWSVASDAAPDRSALQVVEGPPIPRPPSNPPAHPTEKPQADNFPTFWDLALALNRLDPAALAVAQGGTDRLLTIEETELKKLLGTPWFRSVFPRFSEPWRERILGVLVESTVFPNHVLKVGRHEIPLSEIKYTQLQEIFSKASLTDAIRDDLRLMLAVGNLWGPEGLSRLQFMDTGQTRETSRLSGLLHGFRT